jgi:hypothetical protein
VTGATGPKGVTGATGPPGGPNYWVAGTTGATSIYYGGSVYIADSLTVTETITAGSDYRIKNDISSINLDIFSVDNLNPVYFRFKKDNKESIGLIAHELQEFYPFLVEGEKDGEQTQTVNYNGLVGVLIKEIQELKKRVNYLENKIE